MKNTNLNTTLQDDDSNLGVTFIQDRQPKLKAGEFTVEITQQTGGQVDDRSVGGKDGYFEISKSFYVGGERFKLSPEILHTMSPAPAYAGDVSNRLPNIVITDPHYPWLRLAGSSGDKKTPWIGLLLFYGNEAVPEIKNINLGDLKESSTDRLFCSVNELEHGQDDTDTCQIIDVDVTTFNAIAPSSDDLPYLAHVRKVDVINKACKREYEHHPKKGITLKTQEPQQEFSVVVCNRLPKADTACHLFLVSFEDMGDKLPDDNGASNFEPGVETVRLVVLKNWEFYCTQIENKIADSLNNWNRKSRAMIGKPYSSPITLNFDRVGTEQPEPNIMDAFLNGYVPLNHEMRNGGNTVSWLRSPFIPVEVDKVLEAPFKGADELMRYNPDTGMFDATYASAWQLGKLLALQNKGFAEQLYHWKEKQKAEQIAVVEQSALKEALGLPDTEEDAISKQVLKTKCLPMMEGLFKNEKSRFLKNENLQTKRKEAIEETLNGVEQSDLDAVKSTSETDDKSIIRWLADLGLFYGVPYRYLVPNSDLLMDESIKIFYVDPNYIEALVDGAFSIGRSLHFDEAMDKATFSKLSGKINHTKRNLRRRMFGMNETHYKDAPMTGFLLNSRIVDDFPGLEVIGKNEAGEELPILRMERLSDGILLCIFHGLLTSIVFQQPAEGLKYGLDGTPGNYKQTLRNQNPTNEEYKLGQIDPSATVEVNTFRGDNRVLQVAKLAPSIYYALINYENELAEYMDELTSADFALQMSEGAEQITLDHFKKTKDGYS